MWTGAWDGPCTVPQGITAAPYWYDDMPEWRPQGDLTNGAKHTEQSQSLREQQAVKDLFKKLPVGPARLTHFPAHFVRPVLCALLDLAAFFILLFT